VDDLAHHDADSAGEYWRLWSLQLLPEYRLVPKEFDDDKKEQRRKPLMKVLRVVKANCVEQLPCWFSNVPAFLLVLYYIRQRQLLSFAAAEEPKATEHLGRKNALGTLLSLSKNVDQKRAETRNRCCAAFPSHLLLSR